MNVQRIDSQKSNTSFGMLKPGFKMPAETFKKILNTPVVADFSKNFDGDVYIGNFIGTKSERLQYSLDIRNVIPRSFKAKVKNFFKGQDRDMVILKTHATNLDDFQEALSRRDKDALSDIFFSKD